jgi:hypothetical protein
MADKNREDLRMKLKLKIASVKMGRLPAEVKEEKLDKLKEGLDEILKPTGMSADDFLDKIKAGQRARK